jgi:hypothetical protein
MITDTEGVLYALAFGTVGLAFVGVPLCVGIRYLFDIWPLHSRESVKPAPISVCLASSPVSRNPGGHVITLDESGAQFKRSYEVMRQKAGLPKPQRTGPGPRPAPEGKIGAVDQEACKAFPR